MGLAYPEGTEREGRRAAGRVGESEREPRVEVLSFVDSGEHEREHAGVQIDAFYSPNQDGSRLPGALECLLELFHVRSCT
jgi:hypothetical protein